MRLDEHGFGHHFAGKGLARVGIDQFVASSETTLKQPHWSELKTKHTRMKLTLPRNLPLEYWVRVRGSVITLGMLNSSFMASMLLFSLSLCLSLEECNAEEIDDDVPYPSVYGVWRFRVVLACERKAVWSSRIMMCYCSNRVCLSTSPCHDSSRRRKERKKHLPADKT